MRNTEWTFHHGGHVVPGVRHARHLHDRVARRRFPHRVDASRVHSDGGVMFMLRARRRGCDKKQGARGERKKASRPMMGTRR